MDLTKVLTQLRQELGHLDAAILSLERLQTRQAQHAHPSQTLLEVRKLKESSQSSSTPRRPARRRSAT